MPDRAYQIPYSKTTITFALPAGMQGIEVVSAPVEPVDDVRKAIRDAIVRPVTEKKFIFF